MTTPFFAEELDSGSKCSAGHPLMLVAEGYAYCCAEEPFGIPAGYYAWRFTPPATDEGLESEAHGCYWDVSQLEDGKIAWVLDARWVGNKERALAFILADIKAHRELPFDEEREQTKQMPV